MLFGRSLKLFRCDLLCPVYSGPNSFYFMVQPSIRVLLRNEETGFPSMNYVGIFTNVYGNIRFMTLKFMTSNQQLKYLGAYLFTI